MKYTVLVRVLKAKTKGWGYISLPSYRFVYNVEAKDEAEAVQKAVKQIDPYMEPQPRESMVVNHA